MVEQAGATEERCKEGAGCRQSSGSVGAERAAHRGTESEVGPVRAWRDRERDSREFDEVRRQEQGADREGGEEAKCEAAESAGVGERGWAMA